MLRMTRNVTPRPLEVASKEDLRKEVEEDYVTTYVVNDDLKKLPPPVLSCAALQKVASLPKVSRTLRVRMKLGEQRVNLVQDVTVTSAANTALQSVTNLRPDQTNEFSSCATLYDELRVEGYTVHIGTGITPGALVRVVGALSFDPSDLVAETSVANCLTNSQHFGPFIYPANPSVTGATGTVPLSRTGFWTFKVKFPKGSCRSSGAPTIFGHDWMSTSDSGDIYGFLKTFVEAAGAGISTSLRLLIVHHVSLRSRQ